MSDKFWQAVNPITHTKESDSVYEFDYFCDNKDNNPPKMNKFVADSLPKDCKCVIGEWEPVVSTDIVVFDNPCMDNWVENNEIFDAEMQRAIDLSMMDIDKSKIHVVGFSGEHSNLSRFQKNYEYFYYKLHLTNIMGLASAFRAWTIDTSICFELTNIFESTEREFGLLTTDDNDNNCDITLTGDFHTEDVSTQMIDNVIGKLVGHYGYHLFVKYNTSKLTERSMRLRNGTAQIMFNVNINKPVWEIILMYLHLLDIDNLFAAVKGYFTLSSLETIIRARVRIASYKNKKMKR